jgi:hypothetical protein
MTNAATIKLIDTLRVATAEAWFNFLTCDTTDETLLHNSRFLAGRFHALRDAYQIAGGNRGSLTSALAAIELTIGEPVMA